jgi:hypothetical protein
MPTQLSILHSSHNHDPETAALTSAHRVIDHINHARLFALLTAPSLGLPSHRALPYNLVSPGRPRKGIKSVGGKHGANQKRAVG